MQARWREFGGRGAPAGARGLTQSTSPIEWSVREGESTTLYCYILLLLSLPSDNGLHELSRWSIKTFLREEISVHEGNLPTESIYLLCLLPFTFHSVCCLCSLLHQVLILALLRGNVKQYLENVTVVAIHSDVTYMVILNNNMVKCSLLIVRINSNVK